MDNKKSFFMEERQRMAAHMATFYCFNPNQQFAGSKWKVFSIRISWSLHVQCAQTGRIETNNRHIWAWKTSEIQWKKIILPVVVFNERGYTVYLTDQ